MTLLNWILITVFAVLVVALFIIVVIVKRKAKDYEGICGINHGNHDKCNFHRSHMQKPDRGKSHEENDRRKYGQLCHPTCFRRNVLIHLFNPPAIVFVSKSRRSEASAYLPASFRE